MKPRHLALLLALLPLSLNSTARAADSPTAAVDGTWTSKLKLPRGGELLTVLVIDQGKFTHRVTAGGVVQFHSTGKVALEEMKPFKLMAFTGVVWGHSETEKLDLGEDRRSPYSLHEGILYLANNFDKLRKDEAPRLDAFEKNRP